jgi:hypothetical protein
LPEEQLSNFQGIHCTMELVYSGYAEKIKTLSGKKFGNTINLVTSDFLNGRRENSLWL